MGGLFSRLYGLVGVVQRRVGGERWRRNAARQLVGYQNAARNVRMLEYTRAQTRSVAGRQTYMKRVERLDTLLGVLEVSVPVVQNSRNQDAVIREVNKARAAIRTCLEETAASEMHTLHPLRASDLPPMPTFAPPSRSVRTIVRPTSVLTRTPVARLAEDEVPLIAA